MASASGGCESGELLYGKIPASEAWYLDRREMSISSTENHSESVTICTPCRVQLNDRKRSMVRVRLYVLHVEYSSMMDRDSW